MNTKKREGFGYADRDMPQNVKQEGSLRSEEFVPQVVKDKKEPDSKKLDSKKEDKRAS